MALCAILIIFFTFYLTIFRQSKDTIKISQCFVTENGLKVVIYLEGVDVPDYLWFIEKAILEYDKYYVYFKEPHEIILEEFTENSITINLYSNQMKIFINQIADLTLNPNSTQYLNAKIYITNSLNDEETCYEAPFANINDFKIDILETSRWKRH